MAPKSTKSPGSIERADVVALLPRRSPDAHKWSVGGLIIVGGAPGFVGAPALCARAALRAGAGIVSVAVARSSVGPIAGIVPEATFLPLPDGDPVQAARKAATLIGERAVKSKALVVGPGLSDDDHARALLNALFGFSERKGSNSFGFGQPAGTRDELRAGAIVGGELPAVVDADGLNWLSTQAEWWKRVTPQSLLMTPHAGEMARLTESTAEEVASDPVSVAVSAAQAWQQTVLLKGSTAVLTDGEVTVTVVDTPVSLASAGTGDVLAGVAGAFLAQGLSLLDAGRLAIYAGSQAARVVESTFGTLGLLAGDLPDAIARALADLERS